MTIPLDSSANFQGISWTIEFWYWKNRAHDEMEGILSGNDHSTEHFHIAFDGSEIKVDFFNDATSFNVAGQELHKW